MAWLVPQRFAGPRCDFQELCHNSPLQLIFWAAYWIRSWSILSKEKERSILSKCWQQLQITVMEFFQQIWMEDYKQDYWRVCYPVVCCDVLQPMCCFCFQTYGCKLPICCKCLSPCQKKLQWHAEYISFISVYIVPLIVSKISRLPPL